MADHPSHQLLHVVVIAKGGSAELWSGNLPAIPSVGHHLLLPDGRHTVTEAPVVWQLTSEDRAQVTITVEPTKQRSAPWAQRG
jgi:hypothetical protein